MSPSYSTATAKRQCARLDRIDSSVIDAPYKPDEAPSPNAKQLVQRRRNAALQSERNGIKQIAPFLGFTGEVEGTPRLTLDPLLATKDGLALHSFFLPSAPNPAIVTTWKALSQPQPDLHHAQNQAARDGAVAVNYIYEFYRAAYNRPPSVVDTHHVSVTCDMELCELWMHWRDDRSHHMELLSSTSNAVLKPFRAEYYASTNRCTSYFDDSDETAEMLVRPLSHCDRTAQHAITIQESNARKPKDEDP
ncbi:hypothetical protein GQ44DRAFT_764481 [Phaeosphaeriaceae sp. PMI808]|nr:hypothetical protein GQ44DRAFT_764481 [Phaeosphaeriaceae sp. PMI808]